MQSDPKVVEFLNTQLTNELTAINQYFLHARTLRHWGVTKLGKHEYDESIEEMRHADWLIERILFLEGLPNLQDLHKLSIGETVSEILSADLALEVAGHAILVPGIKQCEEARDYISREVLERILEDTEEHIDFLETQIGLIGQIRLQNYLQSQMGSHAS